jgi:hypothetical protein
VIGEYHMSEESQGRLRSALATILEYLHRPASYEARVRDPDYDRIAREACPRLSPLVPS